MVFNGIPQCAVRLSNVFRSHGDLGLSFRQEQIRDSFESKDQLPYAPMDTARLFEGCVTIESTVSTMSSVSYGF